MKRRYIVTDLLRLIYFFIYELVIIQIFCKTKFSECSARERGKNGQPADWKEEKGGSMTRSRGSVTIMLSR